MKIKLITIGKTNMPFIKDGVQEYYKRLQKYINFEIHDLEDVKNSKSLNIKDLKLKESELLTKKIKDTDDIILLDEKAKMFSSQEFAKFIEQKIIIGQKDICFIIGGAYGFDNNFANVCTQKISLSLMTFSHQLVRLIFTEQLYRAFTIIKDEPYHHQ